MSTKKELPSIYGIPVKYLALLFLVVQNSGLTLIMRYSRLTAGPRYLTSTAVVLSETLKALVSICMYIVELRANSEYERLPTLSDSSDTTSTTRGCSTRRMCDDLKNGLLRVLIPAGLYTLQNNLQFIAASNLDAATFQVTYQGKILTTAFFAVVMLRQQLTFRKWISLLVLTGGVALVQLPSGSASAAIVEGDRLTGLVAVGVACLSSGLAGVYFEKILKGESVSIWVRNLQLSSWSVLIASVGALAKDGPAIRANGFFQGYNSIVYTTIIVQAAGGIIVAIVVKHADNILKGFATSISIILSVVVSMFLFNFVITGLFVAGAALVLFASYLYGVPEAPKPEPAPKSSEYDEKELFFDESMSEKRKSRV